MKFLIILLLLPFITFAQSADTIIYASCFNKIETSTDFLFSSSVQKQNVGSLECYKKIVRPNIPVLDAEIEKIVNEFDGRQLLKKYKNIKSVYLSSKYTSYKKNLLSILFIGSYTINDKISYTVKIINYDALNNKILVDKDVFNDSPEYKQLVLGKVKQRLSEKFTANNKTTNIESAANSVINTTSFFFNNTGVVYYFHEDSDNSNHIADCATLIPYAELDNYLKPEIKKLIN